MIPFLSKIIKFNHLNVIGVRRSDEQTEYEVLTVKKTGNQLGVLQCAVFQTFDELVSGVDLRLPVIVQIDGQGVLNKKIHTNSETDLNWHKNIDYSNIYHTSLKSSHNHFMSFCRKNVVDEILERFQEKFSIIDVYIGAFSTGILYHTLKSDVLISGNLSLEFENGELSEFSKLAQARKETYTIGNDRISSDFLPLYGVAVHFFVNDARVDKTITDELNIDELLYKKAFHVFGVSLLAFFLSTLLASFLLIQYYGNKNAELNLKTVYANKTYQYILDLEKQKERKQSIAMESGLMSAKFLSFYAYELLNSVPVEISLSELDIIPLEHQPKANQKIDFETNTIRVKGETFHNAAFGKWLEHLKTKNWIKKFEVISLKKDKKNLSKFEVKITPKDV